jgi:hypothetical protein
MGDPICRLRDYLAIEQFGHPDVFADVRSDERVPTHA